MPLKLNIYGSYTMNLARLSVLSASVMIAACGSGGDQFGGAQPPTTTFAITSANAVTAASVSWQAIAASGDFGDLGGGLVLSTDSPGGFAKASVAQKAGGSLVNVVQQVPFGPEVLPCLTDGIVTLSGDIANPETLTVGDTFRAVYELCDDGAGEVIDGAIDFTVREFTGDILTGLYMLSMDTVVTNLQVVTGTDTISNNGDVNVTLDTMLAPLVSAGVSGTSMTVDSNASSETLSAYSSRQTVDGNLQTLPFTLSASGTLDSTQLAGIIRYSTPVTFAGEGADYPSSGALLVEGDNSSARLTAVDNVNVTIEIDSNGDGVIDATIETTWVALAAS
jgi:hypothetical protein